MNVWLSVSSSVDHLLQEAEYFEGAYIYNAMKASAANIVF